MILRIETKQGERFEDLNLAAGVDIEEHSNRLQEVMDHGPGKWAFRVHIAEGKYVFVPGDNIAYITFEEP